MSIPKRILPTIILSQFCCTSLWFASNGILGELLLAFKLAPNALGHLTTAVQFGFILGTLVFALLNIADRFPPSKVFFFSSLLGALFNFGMIWEQNTYLSLMLFRFFTGFFLAGIYPVGMKIATDYFEKGLGKSLGFLVGALVLGTAFPHLLNQIGQQLDWTFVIITTSVLSLLGGILMWSLVPIGPYRTKTSKIDLTASYTIFKNKSFRTSALGYFGHMWELYAFWAFVPVMIASYNQVNPSIDLNVSKWSFLIIGIGSLACIIGGYISLKIGTAKMAYTAVLLSGICCLLSPLAFSVNSSFIFLAFLLFWGITVIADSPLFSTLVAQKAPSEIKGTALTIVNCIGFSITILSIQLLSYLIQLSASNNIYILLALGPLIAILSKRNHLLK